MIYSIQRSYDLDAYENKLEEFLQFCRTQNKLDFFDYFSSNWLCDLWAISWLDMDRPGCRDGIHNTNNCCESFFKTLLRSFLGGVGSRKPSDLLKIIQSNVFVYYDNIIKQMNQYAGKPAVKITKKSHFVVQEKESNIYIVTHPQYSCIVDLNTKQCSCSMYHCAGKCKHIGFVTSLNSNENAQVLPLMSPAKKSQSPPKKKKKGPKKKNHLPFLLREQKMQTNLEKNKPESKKKAAQATTKSKPGPVPAVPSQRRREGLQRNRQPPLRYRKSITD